MHFPARGIEATRVIDGRTESDICIFVLSRKLSPQALLEADDWQIETRLHYTGSSTSPSVRTPPETARTTARQTLQSSTAELSMSPVWIRARHR